MWLPAPIYERLPQVWFLIGLMFFAFGLYLGLDYDLIYGYFGLGAVSIIYSIWLLQTRRKHREESSQSSSNAETHDGENTAAN